MATTRVVSRLCTPIVRNRLSIIGNQTGPVRSFWHHHHHRRNVPDTPFGSISNVFERWEKEFDRMQQQFNTLFQDLKNNRPLTSYSSNGTENDCIITESDGSKKFYLSLNVRDFEPEEIKLKTQNNTLTISAKKEKKGTNTYFLQEFSQTYTIPSEVKIGDLKSTYTENGILSIEAPVTPDDQQTKDRQIKIERA